MKDKLQEYKKLIVFTLVLLACVLYFKEIAGLIGVFFGIISPILAGFVIAFVLNVPMSGIEDLITKIDKKGKCKPGLKRSLAILLTFVIIVVILAIVVVLLVPNIISTITSLIYLLQEELPDLITRIQNKYHIDLTSVQSTIDSLKLSNLLSRAVAMLSGMSALVSSTISKLFNLMMSIIIACYVLAGKEKLMQQLKNVLQAFMKEKHYHALCHVCELINTTYASFLGGQCVEAVIISVLMTVVLAICQIPYAAMIGILAGVLSFIPYIGSFVACFAGAFFILIINPWMAVFEVIVYQIVQMVEDQFIYPRVVGKSVGLPPLLTLIAALLGGKFFGLLGMIFFIPIVSVIYTLVRELTYKRLKKEL